MGHQDDRDRLQLDLVGPARALVAALEGSGEFRVAQQELVRFCSSALVPQLDHDERWLSDAATAAGTRLLAEAVRSQIRAMLGLVQELADANAPWEAVAATRALHALLAAHVRHCDLLASEIGQV